MKLVVIGGVAAGMSAAARARRLSEDAEIVVFERGQYVSFANCGLPYHIGGTIKDRDRLLQHAPSMPGAANVSGSSAESSTSAPEVGMIRVCVAGDKQATPRQA